jgi:glycosyltransferase involved in cell wall biosynthesis
LCVWQRTPLHPLLPADLRRIEADVVHLHSPSPSIEAALLLGAPKRGRLVVTLHNGLPRTTRLQRALGGVETRLLRRVLGRAAGVIAPHPAFADHLLEDAGQVRERLHNVPPGVDHERFRASGETRDGRCIVFAGHLRPEKGLHVLVEAMTRLPDLRLEVLAAVSYESAYYARVRKRAESVLGRRVRFRLNPTQADLARAYNRAGCVVVPSLGLESWNLVMLEAAATGAACVRSDLSGLAWADFAVVAPAGDAAALAEAIERAIGNRDELGCWAERRADEYSWDRTCRETLAVYAAAGA